MKTPETSVERREFGVHKDIIYDLIRSQSGTLEKALLELIMNSMDASATRCVIKLDENGFEVEDDGEGFRCRDDIVHNFEVFGQPHEEGDAPYGRFRVGRGQIMALAHVVWESGDWRMDVDVKQRGLEYHLEEQKDLRPVGCRVTGDFYERLHPSRVDVVKRELMRLIAHVPMPVTVNGTVVGGTGSQAGATSESSRTDGPLSGMTWDIVTDDYRIAWTTHGGVAIYNLGVLVCQYPVNRYGCDAVVVSKRQLPLNMARNDVRLHEVPFWRDIEGHLRQRASDLLCAKSRLDGQTREYFIRQLLFGNEGYEGSPSYSDLRRMRLFIDAKGTHLTLDKLVASRLPWCEEPEPGSSVAKAIAERSQALVFARETLDAFEVRNASELRRSLAAIADEYGHFEDSDALSEKAIADFESLAAYLRDGQEAIPTRDLRPDERMIVKVLGAGAKSMARLLSKTELGNWTARRIRLGISDTCDAWTDGASEIVIERKWVQVAMKGLTGLTRCAQLMLHEYLHTESDLGSHTHDEQFYELYHDLSIDTEVVSQVARMMLHRLQKEFANAHRLPSPPLRQDVGRWSDPALVLNIVLAEGKGARLSALSEAALREAADTFSAQRGATFRAEFWQRSSRGCFDAFAPFFFFEGVMSRLGERDLAERLIALRTVDFHWGESNEPVREWAEVLCSELRNSRYNPGEEALEWIFEWLLKPTRAFHEALSELIQLDENSDVDSVRGEGERLSFISDRHASAASGPSDKHVLKMVREFTESLDDPNGAPERIGELVVQLSNRMRDRGRRDQMLRALFRPEVLKEVEYARAKAS